MKAEAFERRSASKLERRRWRWRKKKERETKLCSSGAARPVDAPPPRRPGHVNRSRAAAQLVAVGATWLAVQLLHKPLLRRRHPASAVCPSVCLGVAWSPRPDTCAQRDGCSVKWLASEARGLRRDWPARASWGVTRPISGRCVSRRGLVFLRGFRHFTHVQNSPFRMHPAERSPFLFVFGSTHINRTW